MWSLRIALISRTGLSAVVYQSSTQFLAIRIGLYEHSSTEPEPFFDSARITFQQCMRGLTVIL